MLDSALKALTIYLHELSISIRIKCGHSHTTYPDAPRHRHQGLSHRLPRPLTVSGTVQPQCQSTPHFWWRVLAFPGSELKPTTLGAGGEARGARSGDVPRREHQFTPDPRAGLGGSPAPGPPPAHSQRACRPPSARRPSAPASPLPGARISRIQGWTPAPGGVDEQRSRGPALRPEPPPPARLPGHHQLWPARDARLWGPSRPPRR